MGSVANYSQLVDTLNQQMSQTSAEFYANGDRFVRFITGSNSQISDAITVVSETLGDLKECVHKPVKNFLLGEFFLSVTSSTELLLAEMVRSADSIDAAMVRQLTGNYSRLIKLSSGCDIDVSKLEQLSQQINKTVERSDRFKLKL